jgi:hypothetical protein
LQVKIVTFNAPPSGALGGMEVGDVYESMPGGAEYDLAVGSSDLQARADAEDVFGRR